MINVTSKSHSKIVRYKLISVSSGIIFHQLFTLDEIGVTALDFGEEEGSCGAEPTYTEED